MEKFEQLILNPVENLPYLITTQMFPETKGLYVSDKTKDDECVKKSKIGFAGREIYNREIHNIYDAWKKILGIDYLSMRLLSGLHAHIIIFMAIGNIGDTVLLLPELAGGHYATKSILERLGYNVIEMAVDYNNYCVDIPATVQIIKQEHPDFIFVDRSEGINYEDFSTLLASVDDSICSIFDASQYLTNILFGNLTSPFDMGFDIVLSTLHKNFPGPQKALVCSKEDSIYWKRVLQGMSDYVSSLHVENILYAGEILKHDGVLKQYSQVMLENSLSLEHELSYLNVPIIPKKEDALPTHHIWIDINNQDKAYEFYKKLENCNILVNYRNLPYNLGYGIRMGTAAATLQGLTPQNCKELANIIAAVYFNEISIEEAKICSTYWIAALSPMTYSIEQQLDNSI